MALRFIEGSWYVVSHTGVTTAKPIPQPVGPPIEVLKQGHVIHGSDVREMLGEPIRLLSLGAIEEAHPSVVRDWQARQAALLGEETEEGAGINDPANAPAKIETDITPLEALPANAIVQNEVPNQNEAVPPIQLVPSEPPASTPVVAANAGDGTVVTPEAGEVAPASRRRANS